MFAPTALFGGFLSDIRIRRTTVLISFQVEPTVIVVSDRTLLPLLNRNDYLKTSK